MCDLLVESTNPLGCILTKGVACSAALKSGHNHCMTDDGPNSAILHSNL